MASTGSVFSETLQTITSTKLEELAKQREVFEQQYSSILKTSKAEQDPIRRLIILVDGAKASLGVKTAARKNKVDGRLGQVLSGGTSNEGLEIDLKNLDRFLEQARHDPSISPKVLQNWEQSLLQYLEVQSSKLQYADLYGKLVTEWLASEKTASTDGDVEMEEAFEEVPNAKKLEARTEWEKVVFVPAVVDKAGLKDYLQRLFITRKKGVATAIKELRDKVEEFELTLSDSSQFNVSTLRWVIQDLQNSDLLNNEKREVLKDFLSNTVILGEIADVLNMRINGLSRWSWGDYVPLEQRRKLNGAYSIHMHEDLLQAIFLHYIGVKWSVFFKTALQTFREQAWKSHHLDISKTDRKRRNYYLGDRGTYTQNNLQDKRGNTHRKQYFAHQLLDHDAQEVQIQEGEEEAEFDQFVQSSAYPSMPQQAMMAQQAMPRQSKATYQMQMQMRAAQQPMMAQQRRDFDRDRRQQDFGPSRKRAAPGGYHGYDSDDDDNKLTKNPIQAKQNLLHLLSTEIMVNTNLHGELNCFRSVFDSWNPLLPHETVLTVMEFFGVSEKWLSFFKTFLQAPLKFIDDGPTEPRLRQRGTPGSHNLSDVFGEVIFACLDFSINQTTDGALLYRLYDDFFFWNHDLEKCAKAWAAVLQFTKFMGVKLSDTKTGSVQIRKDDADIVVDERLPKGQIRWGFLYLDPGTGRFEIDQKMVDSHIEELQKQLQGKSKSVIDWIQVWNSYAATFFSSNFGKAANCFGREHVDKMLATHRRIQDIIFEGGNVVQFLKKTIEERFSVHNIPDGFLFFPVELGGLDLKSPFVNLLQIREGVRETPQDLMDEFLEAEKDDYTQFKRMFDKGDVQRYSSPDSKWKPETGAEEFFTFDEFVKYREEFSSVGRASLLGAYRDLLRRPTEESIDVSLEVKNALDQLHGQNNLRGITNNWDSMEAYWKWVAQMYGPEMIDKFGGLNVVDPGLLPIGMVSMFRQKRIKWQG